MSEPLDLYLRYNSIALYSRTAQRIAPLAELIVQNDAVSRVRKAADVFACLADDGCDSTGEWIKKLILSDDNAFTRRAAAGERIPEHIKKRVVTELLIFKQLSLIDPANLVIERAKDCFPLFGFGGFSATYDGLYKFHRERGSGVFASGNAFSFRGGDMTAVDLPCERLSDLKDYAEEKTEVVNNVDNFINGLPAFHTLLYGDVGTGKTTTVRAVAYEYRDRVKLIELPRGELDKLPSLLNGISGLKQKFIIFIDGLSADLSDGDEDALKAALDGQGDNYLLYCTSDSASHVGGKKSEQEPTLFDRFGLVVTYVNPDREMFVDILKQILRSRGIKWREEYASVAELATVNSGSKSPRTAKRIADLIECTYADSRGYSHG